MKVQGNLSRIELRRDTPKQKHEFKLQIYGYCSDEQAQALREFCEKRGMSTVETLDELGWMIEMELG